MKQPFDMRAFSAKQWKRCVAHNGFNHPLDMWSLSDWLTAVVGEVGEAANIIKKLNRVRDGVTGNGSITPEELRANLADELADTYCYLDLLCLAAGIDLPSAVEHKFNEVSKRIGYDDGI